MKTYLYHRKRPDMKGDIIYPLNDLKNIYPELYNIKAQKYIGRERVMEQRIPTLDNCLWNDVVNLTAVHPSEIQKALVDAGENYGKMEWWQIDPDDLDPTLTTVYLYRHDVVVDRMQADNFTKYDPNDLDKYSHLTQMTRDYYKEQSAKGIGPLLFHGVPHILHKGPISVKNAGVVVV